jgi:hypothetical protein
MDPRSPSSTTQSSAVSSAQPSPSIKPPAPPPLKAPSTEVFLKDFTLLAEAAKRAEMALLMRDFENVGL